MGYNNNISVSFEPLSLDGVKSLDDLLWYENHSLSVINRANELIEAVQNYRTSIMNKANEINNKILQPTLIIRRTHERYGDKKVHYNVFIKNCEASSLPVKSYDDLVGVDVEKYHFLGAEKSLFRLKIKELLKKYNGITLYYYDGYLLKPFKI